MNFSPFHINTSLVKGLTARQMAVAAHRIACNFGARAELSPLVYIILLLILVLGTVQGMSFFSQYWALVLSLSLVSLWRFIVAKKLAQAEKTNYLYWLKKYYFLSLLAGLLWGINNGILIWIDQLNNFSYLVLSLTIATTAGAIGTMASYSRVGFQFITIVWLPILLVLFLQTASETQYAKLVFFMLVILLAFVMLLARRVALDLQTGQLQRLQLEHRSNELSQALKTIGQQQKEVKRHRDHLQELVDKKTIDLVRAKEKAEQADKFKSEFLANISHELRTPMHAILSFSAMGYKRKNFTSRERLGYYFKSIKKSGERLLFLLNDLLDLSKLEAGKMVMAFQEHNLVPLVQRCIAELNPLIEQAELTIITQSCSKELIAHYDPVRIGQVITNLLSNAIKFTPENGVIYIDYGMLTQAHNHQEAHLEEPGLFFLIRDTGVGIPENELGSIFDTFKQSSNTDTGSGGTGLGLSICREIIALHKGLIYAKNSENGGAVFCFQIPLRLMT